MKPITKYYFLAALILSGLFLQGCSKKFLNRPPISQLTSDNFYRTNDEIVAGTAPLYNIVWFDYNDKAFLAFGAAKGGDLNSNDRTAYIQFDVSATDQSTLLTGYKSFYKIVAQSNTTMQNIINANGSTASTVVKNTGIAECRFMRAMAYYFLVSNWGAVPIVYDNAAQLSDNIPRNTIESVWQFILLDLRWAADNLPPAPYQQGRLTKYSAEGMLAKMYLIRSGLNKTEGSRTQSDLDSAKYYAADVIQNSGRSLLPNYYNLFTSADNNSSNNNNEMLFALQWMPTNSPWGVNNSFQAYMAPDPKITQTGDGWGAAQGGSADLVSYFLANPTDSIRRKATIMFPGDVYKELDQKDGGILVANSINYAFVKKYIVGSPADNGGKGAFMAAYINTYMLRLAEVYLIYAEAIMGNNPSTSDATALQYFNAVRTRAGMPSATSITFDDIFREKRIELALEGNAWYDILRWYYFAPAKAMAYVAAQDRATSYTLSLVANSSPKQYTFTSTTQHFPFTASTAYLPFPESEMVMAPSLGDAPVPFDFSKLPK
ncbi:MAG TPA: RagB/SusD family nutrient uptake outer membrane protein [Puia sp.]|nr:RagB/SusD family nutrient uptake outer membrane protein [Puia sp.]